MKRACHPLYRHAGRLVPLDFLFLGVLAKDFFKSQVGGALGNLKLTPAVIFYLIYPPVSSSSSRASGAGLGHSAALTGALFGFFCYATFDLTTLALAARLDLAGGVRRRRAGAPL